MDAEERFLQKRLGYIKCCTLMMHGTPLASVLLNSFSKHVSVDGQIVVRKCQSGSLKYHKYQDTWKMGGKKLVSTTVSSREVGRKRREEGKTMSSQRTQKHTRTKGTMRGQETVVLDRSSNTSMSTFRGA